MSRIKSTPRRYVITGRTNSRVKRRRIGTKTRRKSVKDIVQEMSQQKKRIEENITIVNRGLGSSTLMLRNLRYDNDTASGTYTRNGNLVTLTGLGIKGHLVSQEPAGNTRANTHYLKWYVVTTQREGSPLAYWFQKNQGDGNLNYNLDFTNDFQGDYNRQQARMNKLDIKILGKGVITCQHPNNATSTYRACVPFSAYVKCNIKVHFNTSETDPIPYGVGNVRPNIWFVVLSQNPDNFLTTSTACDVGGSIIVTQYFRE